MQLKAKLFIYQNMKANQKGKQQELERQVELLNYKIQNMVQYHTSLDYRENIYQEVLDSIPAFVFWKDKNNNMLGFNLAYQKAVNISRDELLSKTGFDLFPDAQKYWIDDLEVINSGVPKLNIVEEVIIPPNKSIWFKTDKTPLRDESGKIIGVIGVSIDITELRNTQNKLDLTNRDLLEAQKKLQRLNTELDKKVTQRTQELQEANKNLKRVNLDLDNFIYIASHDLSHPVLNMEGILNQVKNPDLSPEVRSKLMDYLSLSVDKLKKTIIELSDIVKAQYNLDYEIEEIDLRILYDEVIFSLNEIFREFPPLKFHVDFTSCPVIRFGRKNLRSIFFNLISNSVKHQSADNDSYLKIKCRDLGNMVKLEFTDNGEGIKEEHIPKIFEMYRRFNDKVPGSGLGLYIVKRILDNHNGKIKVVSKPGIETKFEIFLPVKPAAAGAGR
jgi:PAS domain S-box-containing protein